MSTNGCTHNIGTGNVYQACGEPISDAVIASHAMGCQVMCEKHFLAYHKAQSVAQVVERAAAAATKRHSCARCSRPAHWIPGAGEALCPKHEEDY